MEPDHDKLDELCSALENAQANAVSLYADLKIGILNHLDEEHANTLNTLIEDYEFEDAAQLLREQLRETHDWQ